MTSRRFWLTEHELLKRRRWPRVLILIIYLIGFVLIPALRIYSVNMDHDGRVTFLYRVFGGANLAEGLVWEKEYTPVYFNAAVFLGILLAIEGFHYLHSRVQTDFYASQPVSRTARFWGRAANSLILFFLCTLPCVLLSILVLLPSGALQGSIITAMFELWGQMLLYFSEGFAIGALAMTVTGREPFSILLALLAFEPCIRLLLKLLMTVFSKLWPGNLGISDMLRSSIMNPFVMSHVTSKDLAGTVLYTVLLLLLAFLAYRIRKNETAGAAFSFPAVRILFGVLAELIVIIAIFMVLGNITGRVTAAIVAAAAGLFIWFLLETASGRRWKKHPAGGLITTAACLCLIGAVYTIANRYDTYLPDQDQVESVIVAPVAYYTDHWDKNGNNYANTFNYYRDYMKLTDMEAVRKLAQVCIEETVSGSSIDHDEMYSKSLNWPVTIAIQWQLKDGREVSRTYSVDADRVQKSLDQIMSSKEWKEGFFQVYHDEYLLSHIAEMRLFYKVLGEKSQLKDSPETVSSDTLYTEFKTAYEEDLENFSFTEAATQGVAGTICIQPAQGHEDIGIDYNYPVYKDFYNTIEFLKKNRMYVKTDQSEGWKYYNQGIL